MMTPRARKELDLTTYEGRFAARLKMLREKAKLTPEQAAERLGAPKKSVYNWEAAISVPPLGMFPVLAGAYGVSVRSLMPEK